jgi:N-acetylmuramoyl-L-alanine amidase
MPLRVVAIFLLLGCVPVSAAAPIRLENIRTYNYPEYTRVVLDLSATVRIQEKTLRERDRERLFFDLPGCRFGPDFPTGKRREIRIENGNLKDIRLGQWREGTLRVVFDFDRINPYSRFCLTSPFRIVFDIYRTSQAAEPSRQDAPLSGGLEPSMARQLGLGVRRIVIDAGHGGRDPGTVNRRLGLQEKDITLDVARRLQAMLSEHSELEIIMTRRSDEYVALEERTAIANSRRADLFVSIHTNSAPRLTARGVETYFLSLTTDRRAMDVAAQENAMSRKSIGEMRSILDQIIKGANIAESRILTGKLQTSLVGNLRRKFDTIGDLGVKKAPFYVLVGAQMPSSLVEISFLSCQEEARRLATNDYRHMVAGGLYLGVMDFIRSFSQP